MKLQTGLVLKGRGDEERRRDKTGEPEERNGRKKTLEEETRGEEKNRRVEEKGENRRNLPVPQETKIHCKKQ